MSNQLIDLTGTTFGRLTVISRAENTRNGQAQWLCVCECGRETVVQGGHLRSGHTTSCGCLRAEQNREAAVKHGMRNTRLYRIWMQMHARYKATHGKNFAWYGSRGVTVCKEWSDFEHFYNWAVTNGYNDSLTIDRKDTNGGYCPENCRWATVIEQANNKSNNLMITVGDVTMSVNDWSRKSGIKANTIRYRCLHGWDAELAVFSKPYSKAV